MLTFPLSWKFHNNMKKLLKELLVIYNVGVIFYFKKWGPNNSFRSYHKVKP